MDFSHVDLWENAHRKQSKMIVNYCELIEINLAYYWISVQKSKGRAFTRGCTLLKSTILVRNSF